MLVRCENGSDNTTIRPSIFFVKESGLPTSITDVEPDVISNRAAMCVIHQTTAADAWIYPPLTVTESRAKFSYTAHYRPSDAESVSQRYNAACAFYDSSRTEVIANANVISSSISQAYIQPAILPADCTYTANGAKSAWKSTMISDSSSTTLAYVNNAPVFKVSKSVWPSVYEYPDVGCMYWAVVVVKQAAIGNVSLINKVKFTRNYMDGSTMNTADFEMPVKITQIVPNTLKNNVYWTAYYITSYDDKGNSSWNGAYFQKWTQHCGMSMPAIGFNFKLSGYGTLHVTDCGFIGLWAGAK